VTPVAEMAGNNYQPGPITLNLAGDYDKLVRGELTL
jgi:hypothetical protein